MTEFGDESLRRSRLELLAILAGASRDPAYRALAGDVRDGHAALLAQHGGVDVISERVGRLRVVPSQSGVADVGVGDAKRRLDDDDHRDAGALMGELEEATEQLERYEQELNYLRSKMKKKDAKARRQAKRIKELETADSDATERARQLEAEWSQKEGRLRTELSDVRRDLRRSQSELRRLRGSVEKPDADAMKSTRPPGRSGKSISNTSAVPGGNPPGHEGPKSEVGRSRSKTLPRLRDLAPNKPLQPDGDDIHRLLVKYYLNHEPFEHSTLRAVRPLLVALDTAARRLGLRGPDDGFRDQRGFLPNHITAEISPTLAVQLKNLPEHTRENLEELLGRIADETGN